MVGDGGESERALAHCNCIRRSERVSLVIKICYAVSITRCVKYTNVYFFFFSAL